MYPEVPFVHGIFNWNERTTITLLIVGYKASANIVRVYLEHGAVYRYKKPANI